MWLIAIICLLLSILYLKKNWKLILYPNSPFPAHPLNPFKIEHLKPPGTVVIDPSQRAAVLRQPFLPEQLRPDYDAIVIGSGLGGLTTAAILSKAGWRVLVLEQHDVAGGCSHTFTEKGFEFDVGVHIVCGMRKGRPLRALADFITNGQLNWAQMDEHFHIVKINGKEYQLKQSDREAHPTALIAQLKEYFPNDSDDIDQFFAEFQTAQRMYPWLLKAKRVNWYIWKFLSWTGVIHWITRTFKIAAMPSAEVIKRIVKNRDLQIMLMYYYGYYGHGTSDVSFLMHSLFNIPYGDYPIGGSSEIAFTIIPVIEESGGRVVTRAFVNEILINENGRAHGKLIKGVVVKKGTKEYKYFARAIISNAGVPTTFNTMLPRAIAEKTRIWPVAQSLSNGQFGGLQVYISLRGTTEELDLRSQNYFVFDCTDFEAGERWLNLSAEEALDTPVPDFFFCSSSAKDPVSNERHPGKSTMHIISFANPKWFDEWKANEKVRKRGIDYDTFKKTLGDAVLERLLSHKPHLRDKIENVEVSTPLTQKYYVNNHHGEYYSLDHSLARFAPEKWGALRVETDIPGLYLTGQDTYISGVSTVMLLGLDCASVLLNRDLMKDLKIRDLAP